ncbi:host attachment protein [Magnetospirillum moscoviense]|nr:host attachment protein [Magnetospirillum moscoviense]MBF0327217.1 host attachment protein [Alphaproteobacteria bacterium]
MRSSDTWVCVADGSRASFFRCDGPRHDLEPVMGYGVPADGRPFLGRVAGQLDRAARTHLFEHLVLVGPQSVLSALEGHMTPDTRQLVIGEVDRDLIRTTPRELTTCLRDWLPH